MWDISWQMDFFSFYFQTCMIVSKEKRYLICEMMKIKTDRARMNYQPEHEAAALSKYRHYFFSFNYHGIDCNCINYVCGHKTLSISSWEGVYLSRLGKFTSDSKLLLPLVEGIGKQQRQQYQSPSTQQVAVSKRQKQEDVTFISATANAFFNCVSISIASSSRPSRVKHS